MDWILPLEKAAGDVGAAGGKGANLGILIEAGLPVPPGFVLTTAAYREFLRSNSLQTKIEAAAAAVNPDDARSAEQAAEKIAAWMRSADLPPELMEAIRKAYAALGGVPVAVRSSVVTQDNANLPFYGQGETVLHVLGEQMLLEAIRACWVSLWSAQALVYRAGRGIRAQDASMAVVIQHMFRAEASGVIMTVNVETNNPDEMVIRAVRESGDTVLDGQVIPQEIFFNRYSRSITRQSNPGYLVIMPDQALELAQLGERIDHHFGCHQMIEWVWDEDHFAILQSHPIPRQIPPRIRWHLPQPGSVYTRQGLIELLPEPISTLFETCGLPAMEHGILSYQAHLGETETNAAGSFETVNSYVYQRESPRGGLTYLLALPRLRRAAEHVVDYWEKEALPYYQQEVINLTADPQALSALELIDRITSLAQAGGRYWAVVSEMMAPLEQAEQRFHTLYERLAKEGDPPAATFLRGLETRPLQADRAFFAGPNNDLKVFAEQFGEAIYTLDFARPLSGEDLSAWEAARRAAQRGAALVQERFLRGYNERIAAEDRMRTQLSGWQRRMFGPALKDAQRAAKAREDALFELGLAWVPLRRFALELGRRLTAAEGLLEAEQVFWLRRNELFVLAAALDGGAHQVISQVPRVQARQAAYEAACRLEAPLRIPEHEGETRREIGKTIEGRGVSPGMVIGTARILHSSKDFSRLDAGDIIVASAIPPAWTPLFNLAAGAVLELGGAHSYSSRAASLAGLPLVVETEGATRRIRDGDVIRVDGDGGVVIIEEKPRDSNP